MKKRLLTEVLSWIVAVLIIIIIGMGVSIAADARWRNSLQAENQRLTQELETLQKETTRFNNLRSPIEYRAIQEYRETHN